MMMRGQSLRPPALQQRRQHQHRPCLLAQHQPVSNFRRRSSVSIQASAAGGSGSVPGPAVPLGSSTSASPPPTSFGQRMFKSLQDFGIGKNALTEGGVGLFVVIGAAVATGLLAWASGKVMRKGTPYSLTIEFPLASGITVGTPVRIRGVAVGSVLNVKPSLDHVDVVAEINDITTVVPVNSVIEANQSGLIAEPLVDITPMIPLPPATATPLDTTCGNEDSVVCANGRIQGRQGVALDDLVYIMTRIAREMDDAGFEKVFAAAEAATGAVQEAKPLIAEAKTLLEQITPLMAELREGGLVANLEALTKTAADAAADIQKLQSEVMTDENVRALRGSVLTLCKTLEHVEGISGDVGAFARDSGVQRNLRTLVTALSRLVDE